MAFLFLDFEDIVRSPSLVDIEPMPKYPINTRRGFYSKNESPLSRTQAWVEEDFKLVRCPKHSSHIISSGDTDHSTNNPARFRNKKNHRKQKLIPETKYTDPDVRKRKKPYDKHKTNNVEKVKNKDKTSKTRLLKKVVKKKSSYNILIKTCSKKISAASFGNTTGRSKGNLKQINTQEPAAKPVNISFVFF